MSYIETSQTKCHEPFDNIAQKFFNELTDSLLHFVLLPSIYPDPNWFKISNSHSGMLKLLVMKRQQKEQNIAHCRINHYKTEMKKCFRMFVAFCLHNFSV